MCTDQTEPKMPSNPKRKIETENDSDTNSYAKKKATQANKAILHNQTKEQDSSVHSGVF